MKKYIQTRLHTEQINGDCWTTAIECVLDLELGTLPRWDEGTDGSQHWQDVMVYLAHHHNIWCQRLDASFESVLIPKGYHVISGDSPRFPDLGHAVVGFQGKPVHDPHPSGDFVTRITEWEIFAPIPDEAREWFTYFKVKCPCGCGAGEDA